MQAQTGITAAYQLADGLQATVQCTYYKDTPAVEWSLSFRNNGGKNSAVLEHVKPLDIGVEYSPFRTAGTQQYGAHDNILYYSGGSDCKADDFLPLQEILHYISNKGSMHFGSLNGRPTSGSHGCFPYFNLKTQDCGVILALAWGGQWELDLQLQAREPGSSAACFRFPAACRARGSSCSQASKSARRACSSCPGAAKWTMRRTASAATCCAATTRILTAGL